MLVSHLHPSGLLLPSAESGDIAERRAKGTRVMTPFVVCKFLEQNAVTSGVSCMATFRNKGGRLITLNPFSSTRATFELERGAIIYPSCSGGFRRSQTLWALLLPYANSGSIRLAPPHATRYGGDPYNGHVSWHENDEEENKPGDEFECWSGFPKVRRLGFEQLATWEHQLKTSSAESLLPEITQYYNDNYYAPAEALEKHRIYITFAVNAHIHLHRLNESNQSLSKVTVVHIDLDDLITNPPEEWNTSRASSTAYDQFSKLLQQVIDCSALTQM